MKEQKFFGSFFQKRTRLLFEKRSKNFCSDAFAGGRRFLRDVL
jgi:hypothetical protein